MAARVNNVVLDTNYISVGCNRTPHALDWGNNGLVCFAASNAVAIYDPKVGFISVGFITLRLLVDFDIS